MAIETAINRAAEMGLGITITEHMDFGYPKPQVFIFDEKQYFEEYTKYRSDKVLLGVEVGMRGDCVEDGRHLIQNNRFDYVIGSIHLVDNQDIYEASFYQGRSKREVYSHYFADMLDCLQKYDFIDSLGHIDYIARYARYDDPEIYYSEFSDQIDQILKVIVDKGKAIEINTRRLTSAAAVKVLQPIYQRFYELGGRMVTIGSDAHTPTDIGGRLSAAQQLADACQLRIVYFKDSKPEWGR